MVGSQSASAATVGLEAQLTALGADVWTDVARAALRLGGGRAAGWRWEALRSSLGASTAGIYRVHGALVRGGDSREWSAVLKIVRPPSGTRHDADAREPGHWAYWRREPLVYGSDILARLSAGLTAPRCLRLDEWSDDGGGPAAWLWLEHLVDRYGGWWPTERTLLAAEHLGEFGGAFLRRPPEEAWLGRGYLRQRIERAPARLPLFEEDGIWRHEPLRDHFPATTGARLRAVWQRRWELLDALDAVPRTLCHGDSHRGNLFAVSGTRAPTTGEERTAAIDWGSAGIGPIGADLAELALSRAIAGELLAPGGAGFAERAFGRYVAGMRTTASGTDESAARIGFAVTAALAGTSRLHWTLERALDEDRRAGLEGVLRQDSSEVLRRWGALTRMFLSLAETVLPHA